MTDEQIAEFGYAHSDEHDEPLFAFDRAGFIACVHAILARQPAAIGKLEAVAWLYEHAETNARYTTLRPPEEAKAIAAAGWIVTPLCVAPPAQAALTDDPIALLIAKHAEELENNEYAYFEPAYTRRTEWMAWICSNHRDDDSNRKVIARGQGSTPQEACDAALTAAQSASEADHD